MSPLEYVFVSQIATVCGVHRQTVHAWARNERPTLSPFPRQVNPPRAGAPRVYRWLDVAAWLKCNGMSPAPDAPAWARDGFPNYRPKVEPGVDEWAAVSRSNSR